MVHPSRHSPPQLRLRRTRCQFAQYSRSGRPMACRYRHRPCYLPRVPRSVSGHR